jgi:hypothetical protein
MPILYALLLGVSIWPGIWLTDSMLRAYFSWYRIPTWWWYLPLTVPTSPWAMWVAVKKSRATGNAAGLELIQKIAAAVNGEVVMEPTAKPDLAATVQCST